jgi:hypothetical protein
MMEKIFKIAEVIGSESILFPEDAEKLFSVIKSSLEINSTIGISFEEVEDVSSLFLNSFFGKLYGTFNNKFDNNVSFIGIDEDHDIFYDMINKARFLAENPRHNVSSRHLAFTR